MAHLRFHFFFVFLLFFFCNEQRQEIHANWNFLVILGFLKKVQMGGKGAEGGGGGLKGLFFEKR